MSPTTRARRINQKKNAPALKPDALDGALFLLRRGSQVAVTDSTAASVPQRPRIFSLDSKSGQTVTPPGRTRRVSFRRSPSLDSKSGQTVAPPGQTRRVSEAQVKCPVVTEILDSRTQNILKVACCSYQVV